MRTTLDLDADVLAQLKRRREREGGTLGTLASQLLAQALQDTPEAPADLSWATASMGARVDLTDSDAVERALGDGR